MIFVLYVNLLYELAIDLALKTKDYATLLFIIKLSEMTFIKEK